MEPQFSRRAHPRVPYYVETSAQTATADDMPVVICDLSFGGLRLISLSGTLRCGDLLHISLPHSPGQPIPARVVWAAASPRGTAGLQFIHTARSRALVRDILDAIGGTSSVSSTG